MENKKIYDVIVATIPNATEKQIEKIEAYIAELGESKQTDRQNKIKLAYKIRHHYKANLIRYEVIANSDQMNELQRRFRLDDVIIKYKEIPYEEIYNVS